WGGDAVFLRDCQLAALLRYLGCTGSAHEAAALNEGDDQGFLQLFADVDVGRPLEIIARAPRLASRAPLHRRVRAIANLADPRVATHRSLRGGLPARRTGRRRRGGGPGARSDVRTIRWSRHSP